MNRISRTVAVSALVLAMGSFGAAPLLAEHDDRGDYAHKPEAQAFVHGAPAVPSEPWTIAAGGRIYDSWWDALDREEPQETNPAYPETSQISGAATWRCKECHGWDYMGRDGIYSKGKHYTGIKGIREAEGRPVEQIMPILRDANHPYTQEMIRDDEMARVALFVSKGQLDMPSFIDMETRQVKAGDPDRGRGVFQTVCAACHGFDGRMLDWGQDGKHNYIGTEARSLPDEVMNKVMNAHPGVAMVNLRAFPPEVGIDVLAYIATLPTE